MHPGRPSGVVIVDTNALKYLRDDVTRSRVVRSLRAADFFIWPSAINVVEAAESKNRGVRDALLRVLRDLARPLPVLPFPTNLLRDLAFAVKDGKQSAQIDRTNIERLLHDPDGNASLLKATTDFRRSTEAHFASLHESTRPKVQQLIKNEGLRQEWSSAPDFLDRLWMAPPLLPEFSKMFWDYFGMPPNIPADRLLELPAWRMFLELEGIAVFERSVTLEQPPAAHKFDMLQAVYLAAAPRRILVSEDKGTLRVGRALLLGRYTDSRVMTPEELIALAG